MGVDRVVMMEGGRVGRNIDVGCGCGVVGLEAMEKVAPLFHMGAHM